MARLSEVDFQRERLRRDVQELLNALDEATAGDDETMGLDAVAIARAIVVSDGLQPYAKACMARRPVPPA